MSKIHKLIVKNKYPYPFLLFLIIFIVCITNYKWNTWLLGWDVIMPEFNFKVNFWRFLVGGFQEFQGLGVVPIMQKSADLPRLLFLWLFSTIVPSNFLRWFYQFLMLFAGPFGIYFLLKYLFKHEIKTIFKTDAFAFLGALFYLLNLATMQNFYAPLSMFTTWYGFLPWLTLYFIKFVKFGGNKNLLGFILFSIFSTPLAITTTNFVVYFGFIVLLALFLVIQNYRVFKRVVFLIFSILSINAYWLFSFVYSVFTVAKNVSNAKINLMASGDSFLLNKEAGTISNISILKGFWFSNIDYFNDRGVFYLMFEPWLKHLNNNFVLYIGYFIFLFVLVGVGYLLHKKSLILGYFVVVFLISVFLLLNQNPPFGFIFTLLTSISPLLKEALRFPYTKFSIPAGFSYSILFSIGSYTVFLFLNKLIKKELVLQNIVTGVLSLLIIVFSLPAFTGNLIYTNLKVKPPGDYQQVFDYFKNIPAESRIANLPQMSFWGWNYTNWGLRGSGFIWYGLAQPVTDRAFDVWNYKNEQFYNELQYAIYSLDSSLLHSVLNKYNISYLVLDKNVIAPGSNKATFYMQTQKLLSETKSVKFEKQFGNILIYNNTLQNDVVKYLYTPKIFSSVKNSYRFSNVDSIFKNYQTYVNLNDATLNFPFADDTGLENQLNSDYLIFDSGQFLNFTLPNLALNSSIPAIISLNNKNLSIEYKYPQVKNLLTNEVYYNPKFKEEKALNIDYTNADFLLNLKEININSKNEVLLNNKSSLIYYNKINSQVFDFSKSYVSAEPFECDSFMGGSYGKLPYNNGFTLITKKSSVCLPLENIKIPKNSVIKVEYNYLTNSDVYPLYCLDSGNGVCLNNKYGNTGSSTVGKKYVEYVVNNSIVDKNVTLNFILENPTNAESSVSVYNLSVSTYQLLGNLDLAPSLNAYNIGAKIPVSTNTGLRVDLPKYSKEYIAGYGGYNTNQKNCDSFNLQDYSRNLLSDKVGSYYKYFAKDAVSCDSLKNIEIFGNDAWSILFKYKNVVGKGLDVCVGATNLDKCVIQTRLSVNTKNVNSQAFILPPYVSVSGYTVNINNQSIGRDETENNLYSITANYIPYDWLKNIHLGEASTVNNIFEINRSSVVKFGSYYYNFKLNNSQNKEGSGLVVLSQSFENGWGIYDKNSCSLGIISPLTCAKVGEHVLVNNWSNGWLVPSGVSDLTIVFWPQYLQFLGYILFGIWLFVLLITILLQKY